MKDEEFDKLLKAKIQSDNVVPEKINKLFLEFEENANISKCRKYKFMKAFRNVAIAACAMLIIFVGGCTYAHVNGKETIISPILNKIGINSKYEENATKFNSEVFDENIKIKLDNGAIDDTTLILGYEIEKANNNPDIWFEINGEYKVNGMNFIPVSSTIDKVTDNKYVYYQVFDVSEIMIDDPENVYINSNIYEIKEYTEVEDENRAYAEYGDSFSGEWNFEENISVKNLEETKQYELDDVDKYKLVKNVNASVSEFITGSYTNILKIKIDKTNYDGDDFEKYYKIIDDDGSEIAMYNEEQREYDDRVYNDRIISDKILKDSKFKIEVYLKEINEKEFIKVATIPVDLSKAVEKENKQAEWKKYQANGYSFEYDKNWKIISKMGKDKLGENSIYLGALGIEIPSTTNSEYMSSIYVKNVDENMTLEDYYKERRKINSEADSGGYEELESSIFESRNGDAYEIIYELSDGYENYIYKNVFMQGNGKIYDITFSGSEKEYNNLKNDIDKFIDSFKLE